MVMDSLVNTRPSGAAATPTTPRSGMPAGGMAVSRDESFSAMLSRSFLKGGGGPLTPGEETSPGQMFEPAVRDAREHRLASLRADDRIRSVQQESLQEQTRSRVDARRRLDEGAAFSMAVQPVSRMDQENPSAGSEARVAKGTDEQAPGRLSLAEVNEGASREGNVAGPVRYESDRTVSQGTASQDAGARASVDGWPVVGAQGSNVAATAPVTFSRLATDDRAAAQIGRLLGAPRGGENEAARSAPSAAQESGRGNLLRSGLSAKPDGAGSPRFSPGGSTGETALSKRPEFDELLRSLHVRTAARHSYARMQLQPPQLGRIWVDVRLQGDTLRIGVRTETEEARELLAGRANELRVALVQHGISVEQFDVFTDAGHRSPDMLHADGREQSTLAPEAGREGKESRSRSEAVEGESSGEAREGPESSRPAGRERRLDIRV